MRTVASAKLNTAIPNIVASDLQNGRIVGVDQAVFRSVKGLMRKSEGCKATELNNPKITRSRRGGAKARKPMIMTEAVIECFGLSKKADMRSPTLSESDRHAINAKAVRTNISLVTPPNIMDSARTGKVAIRP